MNNLAMKRKLDEGWLIDVSEYPKLGKFFLIPWDELSKTWETGRVDFADITTEQWIWSIGRALKTFRILSANVSYLIHKDQVLASTSTSLYQNDYFDCLWLR